MIKKNPWLIIIFAILMYVMCQVVLVGMMNGIYIGDEKIYYDSAFDIYQLEGINQVQYPILYPLIISASFVFDNPYRVIQGINILLNASIPILVYFFLKDMLNKKKVVLISCFTLITCFAICFPSFVMGENVMYLLFVVAFFYHIRFAGKKELMYAVGAGTLLAMMYLTKYLTLILIPAFGLFWIIQYYNKYSKKESIVTIIKHFVVYGCTTVGILLTYAGIYSCINKVAFNFELIKTVCGFGVATGPEKVGYKFIPDYKWVILYTLYVVILCLPAAITLVDNYKHLLKKDGLEKKMVVLAVFIILGCIYLAARHSTLAPYNADGAMVKMLGRYVTYASFMSLTLCAVFIPEKSGNRGKRKYLKSGILAGVSSIMLVFSYLVLYENLIWDTPADFLNVTRARDLVGYYKFGYLFLVFNIILLIAYVIFTILSKNVKISIVILILMYLPSLLMSTYYVINSNVNQSYISESGKNNEVYINQEQTV